MFTQKKKNLIWDLKHFSIYTLYSQEKSYVFSTWDKKSF